MHPKPPRQNRPWTIIEYFCLSEFYTVYVIKLKEAEVDESSPTPVKNNPIWAILKELLADKRLIPIDAIDKLMIIVAFLPKLSIIIENIK